MARDEGIPSKAYLETLNHWTRDRIVYSEFETKARIAATLRSREFVEAYQKEYARIYDPGLHPRQTKPRTCRSRAVPNSSSSISTRTCPTGITMTLRRQTRSGRSIGSDANGQMVKPVDLREITKVTPVIEQLFPYVNRYHGKFYSLRFPAANVGAAQGGKPEPIRLVFTSVLARVELEWR